MTRSEFDFLADRMAVLTEVASIERDLQTFEAKAGASVYASDLEEIRYRLYVVALIVTQQISHGPVH